MRQSQYAVIFRSRHPSSVWCSDTDRLGRGTRDLSQKQTQQFVVINHGGDVWKRLLVLCVVPASSPLRSQPPEAHWPQDAWGLSVKCFDEWAVMIKRLDCAVRQVAASGGKPVTGWFP